ncbi:MAG TPA: ATP-binding protein [Acidobacteriaceae bacterium]|nr:ATP-binding protein [Acidobacteriaceae bacterium]
MLQVMSRLVVNSLDALPSEGTLNMRLRKLPREIHIMVADNAPGIPPEHIDRVFQSFFTTKTDTTSLLFCRTWRQSGS